MKNKKPFEWPKYPFVVNFLCSQKDIISGLSNEELMKKATHYRIIDLKNVKKIWTKIK